MENDVKLISRSLPKKNLLILGGFMLTMLFTFFPVYLANNYIRQDDLMWEIWPGMHMSDFTFLYYNTVFQLVRPICMMSFYLTDLISFTIHNAAYVRLFSVILLGLLTTLLYFWQIKFNNSRILAATFAIAAFTLPPYQIFAATGNYSLIITSLVMTFAAAFCWYSGFTNNNEKNRSLLYCTGSVLLFASFMDYPLSSMYIWVLLAITYMSTLSLQTKMQILHRQYVIFCSKLTIGLMIGYYLFCRLFHFIFHVDLESGRVAVIKTAHIVPRLARIFDVISWHSYLWLWTDTVKIWHSFFPYILALLVTALFIHYKASHNDLKKNFKQVTKTLFVLFLFFFLAYSPVLATHELEITYRYGIATMPLMLYLIFWSINALTPNRLKIVSSMIFILLSIFGMGYANLMTADGIIGPHEHDFAFMQHELNAKALPLLALKKPFVIHAIACDSKDNKIGSNLPKSFEYGMRTCQYQQQVIGVLIHSLNQMGYESNYRRHNLITYIDHHDDHKIIVQDVPWGVLVVDSSDSNLKDLSKITHKLPVVTIDTRTMQPYQRFELYQTLFRKIVA